MHQSSTILPHTNAIAANHVTENASLSFQPEKNERHKGFHGHLIQSKLSVRLPNDPFEHEADAMADKVIRMPEQSFIQRKCAHCEEEEKAQRKPLIPFIKKEASVNNIIQRKEFKSTSRANADTPELINDTVIKSSLLAKYVGADKVKAAFLNSKNFHVIQDYELEEFGKKCKQGNIVDKAGGFFCRNVASAKDKDLRGDIFVVRYLKLGYVIHEFIHKLSGPTVKNMLGIFVNEGITQYFTDHFLAEGQYDILTDHGYMDNLACANKIVSQTNEQLVADAYFNNSTKLVESLQKILNLKTFNDVKPYFEQHQCIP
jgi:hypothetical protein